MPAAAPATADSPGADPSGAPVAPPQPAPHQAGGRSRRLFRPIDVVDEPLAARLGSPFRPYFRLAMYGLLVLLLMPVQALVVATGRRRLAERVPQFFHRVCLRVLGIRAISRGRISDSRPTLFVCNHSSYLDITVLGALIAGCFIAKAEVAGWPLFGLLARLQRTVFVDRRRNSTHQQRDRITDRVAAGDNLILFPEGTSSDGNRTLPFRSALLSVAEAGRGAQNGIPLTVQPVSIAYTMLNGMPIGHGLRPLVAWYGDMALADHLWQFLRLGKLTVEVQFHEPVNIYRFGSRKALTDHCYSKVAEGVNAALTGRRAAVSETRPAGALPADSGQSTEPVDESAADGAADPASAAPGAPR